MRLSHCITLFPALFLLAACAAEKPPVAKIDPDSQFETWQVVTTPQKDADDLCYTVSAPVKIDAKFKGKRNTPYLMATRRTSGKIEVSVSAGYPLKKDSDVEIASANRTFLLMSKGTLGWAYDDAEDRAVVNTLLRPGTLSVSAVGVKDEATTDMYSTKGFRKALARVKELCP